VDLCEGVISSSLSKSYKWVLLALKWPTCDVYPLEYVLDLIIFHLNGRQTKDTHSITSQTRPPASPPGRQSCRPSHAPTCYYTKTPRLMPATTFTSSFIVHSLQKTSFFPPPAPFHSCARRIQKHHLHHSLEKGRKRGGSGCNDRGTKNAVSRLQCAQYVMGL